MKKNVTQNEISRKKKDFLREKLIEARENIKNEEKIYDFNIEFDLSDPEQVLQEQLIDISVDLVLLREKKGMTQKQLADLTGKQQSKISKLENLSGDLPSLKTLIEVIQALGQRFSMTAYGEYTYTVPEEYRETIDTIAEAKNQRKEKILESLISKELEYFQNVDPEKAFTEAEILFNKEEIGDFVLTEYGNENPPFYDIPTEYIEAETLCNSNEMLLW